MPWTWANRAERLLASHVDEEGRVDYGRFGEAALKEILQGMAAQDPRGFRDDAEALAFYLNAYNFTALAIADRMRRSRSDFAREGLRGWDARILFFFLERSRIASRKRSLFGLEFWTIRRRFKDPRVHFALVCATRSCPPLRGGLYRAERIEDDLEVAARNFVRPGLGYVLDKGAGTITLNRIFRWYSRDFRSVGGPLGAIARWGLPEDAEYVRTHPLRVGHAKYDWGLNRADASRDEPSNHSG